MEEAAAKVNPAMVEQTTCTGGGLAELQTLRDTVTRLSRENDTLRDSLESKTLELQGAQQRVEALEAERDTLRTKCDAASRRADFFQTSNLDLQSTTRENADKITKLTIEKCHAIANFVHEQSRTKEKDEEVRSTKLELEAIGTAYQQLLLPQKDKASGRSKNIEQKQSFDLRSKEAKTKIELRVVQCVQCYKNKWPCDAGPKCQACTARGIPESCTRMKCKFWATGTCTNPRCSLAHKQDGFSNVMGYRKIRQKVVPIPPEVARTLNTFIMPPEKTSGPNSLKRPYTHEANVQDGTQATKRAKLESAAMKVQDTSSQEMDTSPDAEDAPGRTMFFDAFTALRGYAHNSIEEARVGDYSLGNCYKGHYPKDLPADAVYNAPGFVGGSMQAPVAGAKLDVNKLFGLSPQEAPQNDQE